MGPDLSGLSLLIYGVMIGGFIALISLIIMHTLVIKKKYKKLRFLIPHLIFTAIFTFYGLFICASDVPTRVGPKDNILIGCLYMLYALIMTYIPIRQYIQIPENVKKSAKQKPYFLVIAILLSTIIICLFLLILSFRRDTSEYKVIGQTYASCVKRFGEPQKVSLPRESFWEAPKFILNLNDHELNYDPISFKYKGFNIKVIIYKKKCVWVQFIKPDIYLFGSPKLSDGEIKVLTDCNVKGKLISKSKNWLYSWGVSTWVDAYNTMTITYSHQKTPRGGIPSVTISKNSWQRQKKGILRLCKERALKKKKVEQILKEKENFLKKLKLQKEKERVAQEKERVAQEKERYSYKELFTKHKLEAKKGNTEAQYQLAQFYLSGKGVTENLAEGSMWLTIAAKKGHSEAQLLLAVYHFYVSKDLIKTKVWLKKSAAQGNQSALMRLELLKYLEQHPESTSELRDSKYF